MFRIRGTKLRGPSVHGGRDMGNGGDIMEMAIARARSSRAADLEDLKEDLRFPSISALPEHRADCLRNAEWLRQKFDRLGFAAKIIEVVNGAMPLVVAEWNGASGRHLTIYGHYDVQPPDPLEMWRTPPFEP